MAASKYLLGKYIDPPFALAIGMSAAWVRIRREELERHAAMLSASTTTSPSISTTQATTSLATAQGQDTASPPPTHKDTAALLLRRLRAQEWNPTRWNWRGMAEQKERSRWGIVEPGSAQQSMMEEMNRK